MRVPGGKLRTIACALATVCVVAGGLAGPAGAQQAEPDGTSAAVTSPPTTATSAPNTTPPVAQQSEAAGSEIPPVGPVGGHTPGTRPPLNEVGAQVLLGTDATTTTYPWMAALLAEGVPVPNAQFCAGSLVDPSWILTAAHCVEGLTTSDFKVALGHGDLTTIADGDRRAISSITVSPTFTRNGPQQVPANDFALLQLATPATGIPTLAFDAVDEGSTTTAPATILGWGAVDYIPGNPPTFFFVDQLQQAPVTMISQSNCQSLYTSTYFTTASMLCGSGLDYVGLTPPIFAPVSCAGDSGGPVVLGGPGGYRAIGITSWGTVNCADGPSVMTRVSAFASFIQTTIGDAGSIGTYNPIPPVRILDTRPGGLNTGALMSQPLAPGQTIYPQVTGMGSATVPVTGVSSVVLNVTETGPTRGGWLTLFPAGTTLPTASNLNFVAGQTVPNFVTVKLGQGGKVAVSNTGVGIDTPAGGAGTVNVIIDIVGWYANDTNGAYFHPLAPKRLVDTRFGTSVNPGIVGALAPGGLITPVVRGSGPPDTTVDPSASAVVLNVTASVPTAAGWLTVYPNGSTPTASNLNFVPGQTVPNLVTVKVAANSTITVRNTFGAPSAGTVQVIIDVVGWYGPPGDVGVGGTQFHAMSPKRLMDNRPSQAGATSNPSLNSAIGPRATVNPVVRGTGPPDTGVPGTAVAVALNATVTGPSAAGWLTLFPTPTDTPPTASNLNFLAGQTVPNAAIVQVDPTPSNRIGVANTYPGASAGTTFAILDVVGWFE